MQQRILNREELLSHGNVKAREVAVNVIEAALQKVDSYEAVKRMVSVQTAKSLAVGNLTFDLTKIRDIFVIGSGKATFPMARALDEILGKRIKKGLIVVKRGEKRKLRHIEVKEAGHPVPDEAGSEGARQILEIAETAGELDLVFCLITGGASALLPMPADEISLRDKQMVTEYLLKCGANIQEINTVRNHLSMIKGGKLALQIHPAEIVNLIVIDEIAGLPWGPTVPDPTTFADAMSILKKYNLDGKVPESVRRYLVKADPREETPTPDDFARIGVKTHNVILADGGALCEAAKDSAEKLGLRSMILSSVMEGESREVGIALTGVAREIEKDNQPLEKPCVVVVGGETTVTMSDSHGEGGRNQEFALAASLKIDGSKSIAIASIGTDGTDGPTDIAGAIVDGYTVQRSLKEGLDIYGNLMCHNSSYVFRRLGDAIFTGSTGTNVMDLRLLVVVNPETSRGSVSRRAVNEV